MSYKQTDKYGVLANATEIMHKGINADAIVRRDGFDIDTGISLDALRKAYKSAESSIIEYIRAKVGSVNTVDTLSELFKDTLCAFGGMGLRYARIKATIEGEKKSAKQQFKKAIEDGGCHDCLFPQDMPDLSSLNLGFSALHTPTPSTPHTAYAIAEEAYGDNICSSGADKYAIALLPLLLYWHETGSNLRLDPNIDIFQEGIMGMVTGEGFADFPLVGYYKTEGTPGDGLYTTEFIPAINADFVRLFAGKLTALYEVAPESSDYYRIADIKRYIHNHLSTTFFFGRPVEVYSGVSRILDAERRGETITCERFGGLSSPEASVVIMRCDMQHEAQYDINKAGLLSYVAALEALGLTDLPDAAAIAAKIRSCCA